MGSIPAGIDLVAGTPAPSSRPNPLADVTPARIGLLIDYLDRDGGFDENILPSLQLVADEFVAGGIIERPVEFVTRAVQGLPN